MAGKEVIEDMTKESENHYLGWRVMPFIIGNETFEKLGAVGTLANLLIYLTTVFNMDSVTVATIITIFNGTCNIATLFGAFLSDSFFGRYKTLGFASITSCLGLLVIELTAAIPGLHPLHHGEDNGRSKGPTGGQLAVLFTGFGLMVVGAGGVRPCSLPFGADQFNPEAEMGKKNIATFFNWYFFTFTFAELVSLTLIVYVQSNVSWAIGLGIPLILMFIACVLYFAGSNFYVKVRASGSPLTSTAQVLVAAFKKRPLRPFEHPGDSLFNFISPKSINMKLAHTDQFRFLDKAAYKTSDDRINSDGSSSDPWKLCSMQQVEEVKCMIRVIPIWFAQVIIGVPAILVSTYSVFQAVQSDRRLGHGSSFKIPAASYAVFTMLAFSIFIPLYDRVLVPFLRRITGKEQGITVLTRIGITIIGFTLSMIVAGIVERKRRNLALTMPTVGNVPRKGAISSMSGLWLIPQLVITGISEAFGTVGQMEFYYNQFPENMRSIAASLFFCGMAGSYYFSTLLITIVHRATRKRLEWLPEDLNKGRLDYFYFMIAVFVIFDLGYFMLCAKWYRYKGSHNHAPSVKQRSPMSEI